MSRKRAINVDRCYVESYEIDYAQQIYICRSRDLAHPIGLVIGRAHWNKKRYTWFEVQLSFVVDFARRCGVRTLINRNILSKFQRIISASGTREGAAFMRASGYARDSILGWKLDRK